MGFKIGSHFGGRTSGSRKGVAAPEVQQRSYLKPQPHWIVLVVACAMAVLLLSSCASTYMTSFRDPSSAPGSATRIAVIVNSPNLIDRARIEAGLVEALQHQGAFAVAGATLFPPTRAISDTAAVDVMRHKDIDSYLIVALGEYGVDAFHVPALVPDGVYDAAHASVFEFRYAREHDAPRPGFFRVMLVATSTNEIQWIADAVASGSKWADLANMESTFCNAVAGRLRSSGVLGRRDEKSDVNVDDATMVTDNAVHFGMRTTKTTRDHARIAGMKKPAGVTVTWVQSGGLADRMGVREGDIVLSLGGEKINNPDELERVRETYPSNRPAILGLWRDAKEVELRESR